MLLCVRLYFLFNSIEFKVDHYHLRCPKKILRKFSFDTHTRTSIASIYFVLQADQIKRIWLVYHVVESHSIRAHFQRILLSHGHNAATLCHWRWNNIYKIFNGLFIRKCLYSACAVDNSDDCYNNNSNGPHIVYTAHRTPNQHTKANRFPTVYFWFVGCLLRHWLWW